MTIGRLILLLALASVAVAPSGGSFAADTALSRIQNDWEQREESFRSGRVKWTQRQTSAEGALIYTGMSYVGPGMPRREAPKPSPAISGVTTQREFTFDGPKCRYLYTGMAWNEMRARFEPQSRVRTYDGSRSRYLREYEGEENDTRSHGHFEEESGGIDTACLDYNIEPLVMAFRPLMAEFSPLPLAKFSLESSQQVGGVACVTLHWNRGGGVEDFLWLDPLRQHVLVRHDMLVEKSLHSRLDVEYDDQLSPSRWNYVEFWNTNHEFRFSHTGEVTSRELNGPIESTVFELHFPPGAQINGRSRDVGTYVVRKDGTLRRVESSEFKGGLTLDDLAETPTFEELSRQRRWQIWLTVACVSAAAGVAFLLVRRGVRSPR